MTEPTPYRLASALSTVRLQGCIDALLGGGHTLHRHTDGRWSLTLNDVGCGKLAEMLTGAATVLWGAQAKAP